MIGFAMTGFTAFTDHTVIMPYFLHIHDVTMEIIALRGIVGGREASRMFEDVAGFHKRCDESLFVLSSTLDSRDSRAAHWQRVLSTYLKTSCGPPRNDRLCFENNWKEVVNNLSWSVGRLNKV